MLFLNWPNDLDTQTWPQDMVKMYLYTENEIPSISGQKL